MKLAIILAAANQNGKLPKAIINFNADTLLYGVLDLFLICEHYNKVGVWEHPKPLYKKSLRGIDTSATGVTPIYHCHGAVSPITQKLRKKKRKDSREQLVFREQDYLEIAGSMSTWAQTVFLFLAQSSRMLILGHSMSDPNIRKWLAWSHENSIKEISSITDANEITPRHIWINRRPKDKTQREIIEISLLHIGVRVCWIDDWLKIDDVLKNLLAL